MSTLLFGVKGKFIRHGEHASGPLWKSSCVDMGVGGEQVFPAQAILFSIDPLSPENFEDRSRIVGRVKHGFGVMKLVPFQDFA
jgi:hypothetical protein